MNSIIIRILVVILFISMLSSKLTAETVYKPEVLFTIPWGDDIDQISLWWKDPTGLPDSEYQEWIDAPQPTDISPNGGYVIVSEEGYGISAILSKYSIDGQFVNRVSLYEINSGFPNEMSINDSGAVLILARPQLTLLDSNLQKIELQPEFDIHVRSSRIYPSENGFWYIYILGTPGDIYNNDCSQYLLHINNDGTLSAEIQLTSVSCDDPNRMIYRYISPSGQSFQYFTDKDGYEYQIGWVTMNDQPIYRMAKLTSHGIVTYTHDLQGINDWYCLEFFPTRSGDYYTQHATSEGLVITKYSLNHDPICLLEVVTPMPYVGSLPAAITFDASGSYDPDGDPITYHWDFNNDGTFDGVGDEYTGDPWNPTHEFTSHGQHTVRLKVKDNYSGKCIATVQVLIMKYAMSEIDEI